MASVKYFMKKNPSIYVRFTNGKMFDISASSQISIDPKYWDKKHQKIKNVIAVTNRDKINEKLALLKIHIINSFNESYITGEVIDRNWLNNTIKTFFNRPEKDDANQKHCIYLSDFMTWWLNNKADNFKVGPDKLMDSRTKGHYEQVRDNVLEYEGKNKTPLKNIDTNYLDTFSLFLTNKKKYAHATAKRKLSRIKFFCARAEEENIQVNKGYKSRVFVNKYEETYKHPYLNEDEITKVFNYKSNKKHLNIARDNWIIGLWTGLRISDFLTRLDVSNIEGDFIYIKTLKTGTKVAIPLHWQVKEVLKRYEGNLPPKLSEQHFNKHIKQIAKDLKFNNLMLGGIVVVENKIKRKKVKEYPKWKLITSHICRRSFCTNLFGKVPNKVIMDVAGWSSEKQMLEYNKETNKESAIKLKEYWDSKKYKNENKR